MPFSFRLEGRAGAARAGRFATPHGEVRTPSFMVVGTHAAVRALTPDQVRDAGTQVVLVETKGQDQLATDEITELGAGVPHERSGGR